VKDAGQQIAEDARRVDGTGTLDVLDERSQNAREPVGRRRRFLDGRDRRLVPAEVERRSKRREPVRPQTVGHLHKALEIGRGDRGRKDVVGRSGESELIGRQDAERRQEVEP
jgi:hypothetical protein